MDHDSDALITLKPRSIRLKDEGSVWFPATHKPIGVFSKLDDFKNHQQYVENSLSKGLKFHMVNVLHKDYKFSMGHTYEIGKNEEQLPTGKTDGQRAAYTMDGSLTYNEWTMYLSRVQNSRALLAIIRKGENGNVIIRGQNMTCPDVPPMTHWDIDMDYVYKDMNFETKITTEPKVTFGYSQPWSEKLGLGTNIEINPMADKAKVGFIGKYSEKTATTIASLTTGDGGSQSMSISYLQSVLPNVRFICRNDISLAKKSPMGAEKDWVSVLRLGYQARFPSSQIEVNGLFDSTGNVSCLYSMPLINTQMTLSGTMNPSKNNYEFGVGFQLTL
jgi:hypothetical protein